MLKLTTGSISILVLKMTTTGGGGGVSIEQREVNHAYYKYEDDKYSVSENITIQFENNNAFRIKSAKSNTQVDHRKYFNCF